MNELSISRIINNLKDIEDILVEFEAFLNIYADAEQINGVMKPNRAMTLLGHLEDLVCTLGKVREILDES